MEKPFHDVDPKQKLPHVEHAILDYWDRNNTFKKTLDARKNAPLYNFYDGPPFATGTPHYGHFVPSTMKDVVPRYWTMRGYLVERRWGWDCHGLPIENIVEKEMGSQAKKDIEALGIKKFNELCRSKVLGYVDEWKVVIRRLGRWADMDDPYKTMDPEFMESVWWVFRELWEKGLIYESYRSMHICPRCETTLSQSEVTEGYRDVKDISVTAKFELLDTDSEDSRKTYVLAWTTTPWTLIGNTALAVHPDIRYATVSVAEDENLYIAAIDRLDEVFSEKEYAIVDDYKGSELLGKLYRPLFTYYAEDSSLKNKENGWKIYGGDFVTTEEGTGIVHIAPAFGEDDMRLGNENHLPFIQHVGMDGIIEEKASDFSGLHVKPIDDHTKTDVEIIKNLAHRELLFSKKKFEHSYPHCWRCDTPLLNYATSSWFVDVTKIKNRALSLARDIHWTPEYIKNGRFGNWLEGARDWSISRQRFWASAVPLWMCNSCKKQRVVGSVMEISDKLGNPNRLYLVRHGQAQSNVEKTLDCEGDPNNTLTKTGEKEILQIADELSSKDIDVVIASPLLRTQSSATLIAQHIGVEMIEDNRLRETGFGRFNGKYEDDLRNIYPHLVDQPEEAEDEVESYSSVRSRLQEFLDEVNEKYKGKNIAVVGHADSIQTLYALTQGLDAEAQRRGWFPKNGQMRSVFSKNVDLHRPYIDDVELDCECGGTMKRIPDVLDTWFDSGSMPYAQLHYPFENQGKFEEGFPAQFIGEAVDQTRAWFYYLHIIATGIKNSVAFENAVVNGIVLAEDGKKMSKKLQNYPDPKEVLEKYGADPLRFYLLSSPVVLAENLNFSEKELQELSRGVFRMLWNSYSFFVLYANVDGWKPDQSNVPLGERKNLLDSWIVSELQLLTKEINEAMEKYELARAVRLLPGFIDNLSNWYIRRSRKRFWKSEDDTDKSQAYETLHYVLVELSKLMAPFTPFIAEEIFRNLTGRESVHLEQYPQFDESRYDENINSQMKRARAVVNVGLQLRSQAGIKVRQPLNAVFVVNHKIQEEFVEIIQDELNVKNIQETDVASINEAKEIIWAETGEIKVGLDTKITPELRLEGQAREIVRAIQAMRKEAGYDVDDRIQVAYQGADGIFEQFGEDIIAKETLATALTSGTLPEPDLEKTISVDGDVCAVQIKK